MSDNTGSGATSGGSDKLIEYMKTEKMNGSSSERKVKLGGMDCNKWEWYRM